MQGSQRQCIQVLPQSQPERLPRHQAHSNNEIPRRHSRP